MGIERSMAEGDRIEDACPTCGAMLGEDDERCPRCGADVTRDRTLEEPVAAPADGPMLTPDHTQDEGTDEVAPPEDVDYRERKPSYEGGIRPPAPDAG